MKSQSITKNEISIKEANLCLLISFILMIAYQYVMRHISFPEAMYRIQMIIPELFLVLPALAVMLKKKMDIRGYTEFKDPEGPAYGMAVAALACSYPIVMILNLISMYFVRNVVADAMPQILSLGIVQAIILMALLPALAEEFLFRGILYHSYRRVSVPLAVITSALLFGLMHMNLNQMPYAFFIGMVLALMVEATGSLYTSVLMHFLLNAFSVAISFMPAGKAAENIDQQEISQMISTLLSEPASLAVLAFVFLISAALLIIVIRRTFNKNGRIILEDYSGENSERLVNVFFLLFIICSVVYMIKHTNYL